MNHSISRQPLQDAIKRTFDIVVTLLILVVAGPILFIAALAIKLESRGPVFYVSKRVGAGYRVFDLYKLRTMSVDADAQLDKLADQNQYKVDSVSSSDSCPQCVELGEFCSPIFVSDDEVICERQLLTRSESEQTVFFKVENDPRITKVGSILRRTSIDELPQLLNVLKGDLSLVGNRPLPLYEAEKLTVDGAVDRFLAPAGITGLWQVSRRGGSEMDLEERIALDSTYARTRSLFGDVIILVRTVPAVFQSVNA
jgi:lipopolysaccharide/colanic/teichoic acid biosynthesis glycosyltransferase